MLSRMARGHWANHTRSQSGQTQSSLVFPESTGLFIGGDFFYLTTKLLWTDPMRGGIPRSWWIFQMRTIVVQPRWGLGKRLSEVGNTRKETLGHLAGH